MRKWMGVLVLVGTFLLSPMTFAEVAVSDRIQEIQSEVAAQFKEVVQNIEASGPYDYEKDYFRVLEVEPDGEGSLTEQIEQYERTHRLTYGDRLSYEIESLEVIDVVEKKLDWRKAFLKTIFTIEKDRAGDLKIPYFCTVLKDLKLDKDSFEKPEAIKAALKGCKKIVERLIAPLPRATKIIPLYLVVLKSNSYGNNKYVKIYIGNVEKGPDGSYVPSGKFLTIDVSVYDHI